MFNWLPWKRKREAEVTREDSLGAVVHRNQRLRAAHSAEGIVTLYAPFRSSPMVEKLSRWLGGPEEAPEAKIELDEVGSFVWDMCDGQTTVREMIAKLAAKYKLGRKEASSSLTAFLRSLAQRNLVAVVILKPEGVTSGEPQSHEDTKNDGKA
jgi:hypothetical protein